MMKNVINLTSNNGETQQEEWKILEEENGNDKKDDLSKNVFQHHKVVDTFQPWPSIEEVKNKRVNLQPIKNRFNENDKKKISFNEFLSSREENDNVIKRTRMELKSLTEMMKEENKNEKIKKSIDDSCIEMVTSTVPLRKKNIFSKTKILSTALTAASHGADILLCRSGDEKEDKINLTKRMNIPLKTLSDPVWKMAPRVEFGDDDSPRVVTD